MAKKEKSGADAILDFCRQKLEAATVDNFNDTLADLAFFVRQPIAAGELDGADVAELIANAGRDKGKEAGDTIKDFREALEAVEVFHENTKDFRESAGESVVVDKEVKKKTRKNNPAPERIDNPDFANPHYRDYGYTDAGFVNRFFDKYVDQFYYVPEWDRWAAWTGTHWSAENGQALLWEAARQLARLRAEEELEYLTGDDQRDLFKACESFFRRYRGTAGLRSFQEMAKYDMRFRKVSAEFDKDPWLLNCKNGTLNLQTLETRAFDPLDYITQQIKVNYDFRAECPLWVEAISKYMCGNEELVGYLKRFLGYSLTGVTSEQAFMVAHGEGANGKGTIARVMSQLLGGYFKSAAANTFYKKPETAGHSDDLAGLRGARLVVASEADEAAKLDEGLIKRLTGEDCIRVAFKNQSFFEFTPTFKIMLAVNHAPRISGRDFGIWRRVHKLPFNYKITVEERLKDPDFENKLILELEGILAWCVEGCAEFRRIGLAPPQAVLDAVEQYKKDTDVLGEFISGCCVLEPGAEETATQLYKEYKEHCTEAAEEPISQRFFGFKLRERNLNKARGRAGIVWKGIRLKNFIERADAYDAAVV